MILPRAASRDFAASDNMLLLARVAETFHCRPSELLGVGKLDAECGNSSPQDPGRRVLPQIRTDDTVALQIDIAAAVSLWLWRQESIKNERGGHEERW